MFLLLFVTLVDFYDCLGLDDSDFYEQQYLHQWTIEIDPTLHSCDDVADSHQLLCDGQVGGLENIYLVQPKRIGKREAEDVWRSLKNDVRIKAIRQHRKTSIFHRDGDMGDSSQSSDFQFNDPLFGKQWSITGTCDGRTLNILPVWKRRYTGKGVHVVIVDDGVDYTHPDLAPNFDRNTSADFAVNSSDPSPKLPSDLHGTKCAGILASVANNNICTVGVAHNVRFGAVRIPFENSSDVAESAALSFNRQNVDIYSNSWGPTDNGMAMHKPTELLQLVFEEGVKKGRNGLGNIFVWASGNGGRNDSCSCDGYASSIYTICVGAINYNNTAPRLSEPCPAKLISSYTGSIASTEVGGNCTTHFGGTSAATPLAAAIYALVLEANPNLTWRDMQYISILAADDSGCISDDWQLNALGRPFSDLCGYGALDALAMIRLAELWTTVPAQRVCSTPVVNETVEFTGNWSRKISFDACFGTGNYVRFAEHVLLQLSYNATRRGDVSITLKSPGGTDSRMLTWRNHDNRTMVQWWPFMSVQFWAERPVGQWTLRFHVRNETVVKLEALQLVVYGTEDVPVRLSEQKRTATLRQTKHELETETIETRKPSWYVSERVDQVLPLYYAKYDRYDGDCHAECDAGCDGPTVFDCRKCKHFVVESDGIQKCVASCPLCTFPLVESGSTPRCLRCDFNCRSPENCIRDANLDGILVFFISVSLLAVILAVLAVFGIQKLCKMKTRTSTRWTSLPTSTNEDHEATEHLMRET